jgi:hypothetical protein
MSIVPELSQRRSESTERAGAEVRSGSAAHRSAIPAAWFSTTHLFPVCSAFPLLSVRMRVSRVPIGRLALLLFTTKRQSHSGPVTAATTPIETANRFSAHAAMRRKSRTHRAQWRLSGWLIQSQPASQRDVLGAWWGSGVGAVTALSLSANRRSWAATTESRAPVSRGGAMAFGGLRGEQERAAFSVNPGHSCAGRTYRSQPLPR